MDLDSYFDFLAPDDIRIKGTRIGIESVLYEYIHRGQAPDAIAARFHTLNRAGTLEVIDGSAHSPRSRLLARHLEGWSGRREMPREWLAR